jgi:hypothetical protein
MGLFHFLTNTDKKQIEWRLVVIGGRRMDVVATKKA